MPRRAYIEHLNALKSSSNIDGVTNVRRGDDDGEFRFQVRLIDQDTFVDITALILPCKSTNDFTKLL
jgi:hypothetical protein